MIAPASLLASNALAEPVWVGGLFVTNLVGADCATENTQIGDLYTAVYHPKLNGDATVTTDVLQIIHGTQRAHRVVPKAPAVHFTSTGSYTEVDWSGRAVIKTNTGTYSGFVVSPAAPTPTTKYVHVSGTFKNINGVACNMSFAAALTLKP